MVDRNELDELEDLISRPGWARYCAAIRDRQAQQFKDGWKRAVAEPNDVQALNFCRQLSAIESAREQDLAWPDQRLAQLKRAATMTLGEYSPRRVP